jgi:hypothetical protein
MNTTAAAINRTAAPIEAEYRSPYGAAGLAALAVWLLYAFTISPTTWFWDTSEYIATAHILGIPHPPGNPVFVLLARAWDILLAPFPISTAVRINLFSATMSALAHGFWFLLAHRILSFFSNDKWFRIIGASAAVLVSATAFTVWNQSNVNEKVYTVSLFTIALLSWLAFHWRDNLGKGKDDNLLILMVFILALSVGNHLMAFLAAPALLVFVLLNDARVLKNWRLYAFGVVAIVIGLSAHMYLPIRAGLQPVINEADPTCPSVSSALASVLTLGRTGCENLSDALNRKQYDKPSMFSDPVAAFRGEDLPRSPSQLAAQMANYFQYFDWQWARSVSGNRSWFGGARPLLTLLFLALGIFGAIQHFRRDKRSFWYFFTLVATLSFGLTFYLNFRYGYSIPMELPMEAREVRERDYFFIVSFSLWGVWAGIGIAALWQWIGTRMNDAKGLAATSRPPLAAAAVLVFALLPFLFNFTWANRSNDWSARDWAYNLLQSVEPYGVLFTNGDNDTFPLWYAQEVEGVRKDVTVIVMSYLNTPWYVRQLKNLTQPCGPNQDPARDETLIICQRPYEPSKGPKFYSGMRVPTKSILPLEDQEIAQIAGTAPFMMQQAQLFQAGSVQSTIPQGEVMVPADIFLAYIIQNSLEDRPIYFASTTQAYEELNLGQQILRQGVAYKLVNGPLQADPGRGIVPMPQNIQPVTGPLMDLPRTAALVDSVFVHHPGFPDDFGAWVDGATQQIPMYYGYTHWGLSEAYAQMGDSVQANRHYQLGERFLALGRR